MADKERVDVLVEFEYDAEEKDELTIRPGDIVKNVVRSEGGWWEGELNGKVGVFPDNFVKVLEVKEENVHRKDTLSHHRKDETHGHHKKEEGHHKKDDAHRKDGMHVKELKNVLSKQPGSVHGPGPAQPGVTKRNRDSVMKRKKFAKVAYSYSPENQDELRLDVGDVVEVLNEEEEGWWRGTVRGQQGLFPSNFVELIVASENENEKNEKKEQNDDKPAGEVTEIKGRKVKGVGLGNIFGSEEIKLRSTVKDKSPAPHDETPPRPIKPISPTASLDRTEASVNQASEEREISQDSASDLDFKKISEQIMKVNAKLSARFRTGDGVGYAQSQMDDIDSIADTSNVEILEETPSTKSSQPFRAFLNNWCTDTNPFIATHQLDFTKNDSSCDDELLSEIIVPAKRNNLNNDDVSMGFEFQAGTPPGDTSLTQVTDITMSPGLRDDTLEISCLSLAKETPPPKLTFKRRRSLHDTPNKRLAKAVKQILREPVDQVESGGASEPNMEVLDSDTVTPKIVKGAGDTSVSVTDGSANSSFQLSLFDSELMGDMGDVLQTLGFTGDELMEKFGIGQEKQASVESVTPECSPGHAAVNVSVAQNDSNRSIDSGLERSKVNQGCAGFDSFCHVPIPDSVDVTKKRLSRLSYILKEDETSMFDDLDEDGDKHVRFSMSPKSPVENAEVFADEPRTLDLGEEPSLLMTLNRTVLDSVDIVDEQETRGKPMKASKPSNQELVRKRSPEVKTYSEHLKLEGKQETSSLDEPIETSKPPSQEVETYLEHLKRRGKLPRSIGSMTNRYQLHRASDSYGTLLADWKISGSPMRDNFWSSSSSTIQRLQEEHQPSRRHSQLGLPGLGLVEKEKPVATVKPFDYSMSSSPVKTSARHFEISPHSKRSGCCIVIVVTDPNGIDAVMDVVKIPEYLRHTGSRPKLGGSLAAMNLADCRLEVPVGSDEFGVRTVNNGLTARDELDVFNESFIESSNESLLDGKTQQEDKMQPTVNMVKRKKSILTRLTTFFRSLGKPKLMKVRSRSKVLPYRTSIEELKGSPKHGRASLSESPRRPPNSFENLSDGEIDYRMVSVDSDSLSDGDIEAVMKRPFRLLPYDEDDEEVSLVRTLYRGPVYGSGEPLDRQDFIDLNESVQTSTPLKSKFKNLKSELTEVCQNNNATAMFVGTEPKILEDESNCQRARKVKMVLDYSAELKKPGLNCPQLPVSKEDLEASIQEMSADELALLASNVVDGVLTRVQHEMEKQQRDDSESIDDLGTSPLFSSEDNMSEVRTNVSESASSDQRLTELLETTCDSEHAEPFYSIAYVSPQGTSYRFNC